MALGVSMDIMGQHNHLGPVNRGPGGSIVQAGWHVLLPTRVPLEPSAHTTRPAISPRSPHRAHDVLRKPLGQARRLRADFSWLKEKDCKPMLCTFFLLVVHSLLKFSM